MSEPVSHTPGPWGVEQTSQSNWIGTIGADGKADWIVCRIERDPSFKPEVIKRKDADALLVAAAPELLRACKMAEEFLALDCDCHEYDDDGNPLKELRSAIAKATLSPACNTQGKPFCDGSSDA